MVVVVVIVDRVALGLDLRLRIGDRACSSRVGVLLGEEDGDFMNSFGVVIDGERYEDCERVIIR